MRRLLISGTVIFSFIWSLGIWAQEVETTNPAGVPEVLNEESGIAESPFPASVIAKPSRPKALTVVVGALPRLPVLAFVDERTQDLHGALLNEWAAEVFREGTFEVQWVRRPRVETWTSVNRLDSIRAMLTEIQTRKPTAVMLWGAVGWPATGTLDPDGHGARVAWTDVPFASDFTNWTDTRDFAIASANSWSRNVAADGRWDQVFNIAAAIRAKRSVGRVDFSNMRTGTAISVVNEDEAMVDYLQRNLAYRRGQSGFSNEVVMVSSLLGATTKSWIRSTVAGRKVTDLGTTAAGQMNPAAGKRYFAMYTSVDSYLREGFRDATGVQTQTLWTILYKSFGADPWNVGATARQYLRQSLVVTWGGRHWMPNGETVHEAYMRHSYPGLGCLTAENTLLGDVTLRLN